MKTILCCFLLSAIAASAQPYYSVQASANGALRPPFTNLFAANSYLLNQVLAWQYKMDKTNGFGSGTHTFQNVIVTGTFTLAGTNQNSSLSVSNARIGSLFLSNSTAIPLVASGGRLVMSNNVLYLVTSAKTNLISDGR